MKKLIFTFLILSSTAYGRNVVAIDAEDLGRFLCQNVYGAFNTKECSKRFSMCITDFLSRRIRLPVYSEHQRVMLAVEYCSNPDILF